MKRSYNYFMLVRRGLFNVATRDEVAKLEQKVDKLTLDFEKFAARHEQNYQNARERRSLLLTTISSLSAAGAAAAAIFSLFYKDEKASAPTLSNEPSSLKPK